MPNDSGREQKGGAAKGKTAAPVLTGKEKAQAIIAAALAEVRQDLTRKANNAGKGRGCTIVFVDQLGEGLFSVTCL